MWPQLRLNDCCVRVFGCSIKVFDCYIRRYSSACDFRKAELLYFTRGPPHQHLVSPPLSNHDYLSSFSVPLLAISTISVVWRSSCGISPNVATSHTKTPKDLHVYRKDFSDSYYICSQLGHTKLALCFKSTLLVNFVTHSYI